MSVSAVGSSASQILTSATGEGKALSETSIKMVKTAMSAEKDLVAQLLPPPDGSKLNMLA